MLNIEIVGNEPDAHYVGRTGKGKSSSLANPFYASARTEAEHNRVCAEFRKHLWTKIQSNDLAVMAELNSILKQARTKKGVKLFCPGYCTQNGLPCHAQVIEKCIRWMDTQ